MSPSSWSAASASGCGSVRGYASCGRGAWWVEPAWWISSMYYIIDVFIYHLYCVIIHVYVYYDICMYMYACIYWCVFVMIDGFMQSDAKIPGNVIYVNNCKHMLIYMRIYLSTHVSNLRKVIPWYCLGNRNSHNGLWSFPMIAPYNEQSKWWWTLFVWKYTLEILRSVVKHGNRQSLELPKGLMGAFSLLTVHFPANHV